MLARLLIGLLLLGFWPGLALAQEGSISAQPLEAPKAAAEDMPASEPVEIVPEPTPVPQKSAPAEKPAAKSAKASAKSKRGPAAKDEDNSGKAPNTVVLQGLNKVTGHISKLDAPLGTVMRFGTLEIIARRCWKSPPEERPEDAALLDIRELKPGEGPHNIFLGWMFSSSPGLSALEHAVYDVNVLACEYHSDPEKRENSSEKTEKSSPPPEKKAAPVPKSGKKPSKK